MRYVRSRKMPAPSGIVSCSPRTWPSARDSGSRWMGGLARLGQLLRVAEQHEVRRRARHGQDVGQGQLPGLVDEERVDAVRELLAGPQPRRARHDVELPVLELRDERAVVQRLRSVVEEALVGVRPSVRCAPGTPRSLACSTTPSRRLRITACEGAVTPTVWPAATRSKDGVGGGEGLARLPEGPGSGGTNPPARG